MRDFLRYLRLTARIVIADEGWYLIVPAIILFVAVGWVAAVANPRDWDPGAAVAMAEVLGALTAAFLCAGILDTERRRGAAEIVFSKPHPAAALLAVRLSLMFLLTVAMIALMLGAIQLAVGPAMIGYALACTLPGCLFMGLLAVTSTQFSRTALAGLAGPLALWFWITTLGMAYNPLLVLPGGALALSSAGGDGSPFSLAANKATLLVLAAALFWFNTRRLVRSGSGVAPGSGRRPFVGRLRASVLPAAILLAYFWSGIASQLVLIGQGSEAAASSNQQTDYQRPYGGQVRAAVNRPYQQIIAMYGLLPIGPLVGAQGVAVLHGLGMGIDATAPDATARKRSWLQQAARMDPASDWGTRARLELAALDHVPAPMPFRMMAEPAADATQNEPQWVTAVLVDPDRWCVMQRPAGADVELADADLAAIAKSAPSAGVRAEALLHRAAIARERWNPAQEQGLLLEVATRYPRSRAAEQIVRVLAVRAASRDELLQAASLTRAAMRAGPPIRSLSLATTLALVQGKLGDAAGKQATLRQAIELGTRLAGQCGGQQRRHIEELLDEARGKPTGGPAVLRSSLPAEVSAPAPVEAGTCGAHLRVMALGRPLPGVAVALAPVETASLCLAAARPKEFGLARPAGVQAPPRRAQGMSVVYHPVWNSEGLREALAEHPALLATTDAAGVARWSGLPAGTYGVVLHAGTWQLPERGVGLAVLPPSQPAVLTGPDAALPDVRIERAIRVRFAAPDDGPPAFSWQPVPGAASYRVALTADEAMAAQPGMLLDRGAGAMALDPTVVWWRDALAATSARLDPARFVGPPGDNLGAGTRPGLGYRVCVEALDASGRPLLTSVELAPTAGLMLEDWTALRPPASPGGTEAPLRGAFTPARGMAPSAGSRLATGAPFDRMEQFSSPFLESITRATPEAEAQAAHSRDLLRQRQARARSLPSVVGQGVGLPARRGVVGVAPADLPPQRTRPAPAAPHAGRRGGLGR